MDDPNILVTNDDGIDAVGLHALREALEPIGSVTVVAPVDDQSAVGRTTSNSVEFRENSHGYVIDGTPVDCVVAGLHSLCPETDIVVSGCNRGANLGAANIGRSGTVSAAVEAAFFDVPAIATSTYIPEAMFGEEGIIAQEEYEEAANAAAHLVTHTSDGDIFADADILNVNAPISTDASGTMEVTRPSDVYRLRSRREGTTVTLEDGIWELMESGSIPDGEGTDRRAVLDGNVSVSPLTAPHMTEDVDSLGRIVEAYSS